MKDNFIDVFFFFHYFVSFLCFLASIVSEEKSAFNYIVLMDMMSHSALATFKIFFFDFQQFDYDISRCLSKFGFIELLGFSRLVFYIRLRKWLSIISSNNFSVISFQPSPSGIPISHIFVYFIVLRVSEVLFILFPIIFPLLFRLNNFC